MSRDESLAYKLSCISEPLQDHDWLAINEAIEALQAAKPEQAQTAVVLPEPVDLAGFGPCAVMGYTDKQMESYATAKTAEAIRELVEGLQEWVSATPGYSATLRNLITKYAPKKEQDNG